MSFDKLDGYVSRGTIREFLEYLLANGTDQVKEAPDQIPSDQPVELRIGSVVNSIKEFHVDRAESFTGTRGKLTTLGYSLVVDDETPELPRGTRTVGIFYMTKKTDYVGDPDVVGSSKHQGNIGDVIWFSAAHWKDLELGKSTEGNNYRLFVFWGLEWSFD